MNENDLVQAYRLGMTYESATYPYQRTDIMSKFRTLCLGRTLVAIERLADEFKRGRRRVNSNVE